MVLRSTGGGGGPAEHRSLDAPTRHEPEQSDDRDEPE
jgi:hypothetical protein